MDNDQKKMSKKMKPPKKLYIDEIRLHTKNQKMTGFKESTQGKPEPPKKSTHASLKNHYFYIIFFNESTRAPAVVKVLENLRR